MLGALGLVAGTAGAVGGLRHVHFAPTAGAPSAPLLPLPGDPPGGSGGSAALSRTQQDFLDDTTELSRQDGAPATPETDPGMASEDLESTAQALTDTVETLNKRQWSAEANGPITTLVNSLEADATVWKAAATSTGDPVAALQAAVRTNDPETALAVARQALGLTDDDQPVDPDGVQPEGSAAPAAV